MIPKKERALAFLAPVFPSSRKRLINITSLVRVGFTMRAEDSNLSLKSIFVATVVVLKLSCMICRFMYV